MKRFTKLFDLINESQENLLEFKDYKIDQLVEHDDMKVEYSYQCVLNGMPGEVVFLRDTINHDGVIYFFNDTEWIVISKGRFSLRYGEFKKDHFSSDDRVENSGEYFKYAEVFNGKRVEIDENSYVVYPSGKYPAMKAFEEFIDYPEINAKRYTYKWYCKKVLTPTEEVLKQCPTYQKFINHCFVLTPHEDVTNGVLLELPFKNVKHIKRDKLKEALNRYSSQFILQIQFQASGRIYFEDEIYSYSKELQGNTRDDRPHYGFTEEEQIELVPNSIKDWEDMFIKAWDYLQESIMSVDSLFKLYEIVPLESGHVEDNNLMGAIDNLWED